MSPGVPAPATPVEDPSGVKAAIERFRDLAKYIVTIFAAVGALLATGSQLSDLGQLSLADDRDRLLAAAAALTVAVGCVIGVVWSALRVLQPIEISLDDVLGDKEVREEIEKGPGPLQERSLAGLKTLLEADPALFDEAERKEHEREASEVRERAAFITARERFKAAWISMLLAGLAGTAAIAVFAWAANPPEGSALIVRPSPVPLRFTLSEGGRDKLRDALGKECVKGSIAALSIGGVEGAPRVVTLPVDGCKPAQFTLTSTLGVPDSKTKAPSK